jgi:aldose sugar dehydrogenase
MPSRWFFGWRTRTFLTVIGAVACISFGGAVAGAQTVRDPSLRVMEVAAGLAEPTAMVFIGPADILVAQKNDGRVRRVTNGALQAGAVLDVAVDADSERGLLGMALHPNFPTTPFIYLYYTESATGGDTNGSPTPLGNRVYRYTWNGSALVSPALIVGLPVTPGPNHDGGTILFGPDGKLYVAIGDLNRNGPLQNNPSGAAPDDTGVILRLDDDGSVPPDNPFTSSGSPMNRYYAYGVRNSFGMSFDPVTNRLWMTENGPDRYDEINLVDPGFNSGWRQIMGPDSRDPEGVGNLFVVPDSHYRDPRFSWLEPVGVTGIAFLGNNAFVGDIIHGRLYRFPLNAARDGFVLSGQGLADLVADSDPELDEVILGTGFAGITDIKVGPDGLLYVLSFGAGAIFRVEPAAAQPPTLSLGFVGLAADYVGQGNAGFTGDGVPDGTFTLFLAPGSGRRTVTRLELRRSDNSGTWDTVPGSPVWALGAAYSPGRAPLNAPDGSVSFFLHEGDTVTLFAADDTGLFAPGSSFTLTATFADGSTAAASATIAPLASIVLAFNGLAADRVGQGNTVVAADGALDGTFTLSLAPGSGPRTVTRLQLRRSSDPGTWDTVPGSPFWTLGAADSDGTPLNAADGSVNFVLPEGASVTLFASDIAGLFAPGSLFTVTATFADGSTAVAFTSPGL